MKKVREVLAWGNASSEEQKAYTSHGAEGSSLGMKGRGEKALDPMGAGMGNLHSSPIAIGTNPEIKGASSKIYGKAFIVSRT